MTGITQPKWLDRTTTHKVKRSKKHELRLADELGGKRELRSGANYVSPWSNQTKGRDINLPEFLVEHKNTVKDSISLKKEWLEGITESAQRAMKDPMLIITFQKDQEKPQDWVMIPLDIFKRIQNNKE